jgi:glycosyltransferase involved in cell wall biosynthesis
VAVDQKSILIVTGDLRRQGGVANFVAMLNRTFSGAVDVTCFRIGPRESGSLRFPRVLYPLIDSIRLAFALFRERHALVHLNPSLNLKSLLRDGLFMLVIVMMRTPRKLVFFHGWDIDVANRITKSGLLRLLFRWTFGRADRIIILANSFREPLEHWGYNKDRIELYSTMFDGKIFSDKHALIGKNNNGGLALLFLSRFVKEKGIFETLEAFDIIREKIHGASLVMAGDGPERKSMEKWVRDHKLVDSIAFPGYLIGKSKAEAMTRAGMFIFPTYAEGCPVSLLEAMAAGLPVITTNVGGIPDVFTDRVNGRMLNEPHAKDIADAVFELAADRQMMASIADNNRQQAWSSYEATVVTARLEILYKNLLMTI